MEYFESTLTESLLEDLIRLSQDWEKEDSCRGYRANTREDIAGNRIFLAKDGETLAGYLFGQVCHAERDSTVMTKGTPFFEVEELYVCPAFRSRGVGSELFRTASAALTGEAEFMLLSTATKNWRAILHFYLEELDLEFWSARLFKKLP